MRLQSLQEYYQTQFASIPASTKKLIIAKSAAELSELLDSGEVTSVELVLCFIERCIRIGFRHNYLQDEMFQ